VRVAQNWRAGGLSANYHITWQPWHVSALGGGSSGTLPLPTAESESSINILHIIRLIIPIKTTIQGLSSVLINAKVVWCFFLV
jgi:hypothetical protein